MPSKLNNLHWQVTHPDNARDQANMERIKVKYVKVVTDNEPPFLDIIPKNATIIIRSYPISENKPWGGRGITSMEQADHLGQVHAEACSNIAKWIKDGYGIAAERLIFSNLNEPEVWPGGSEPRPYVTSYNVTFANVMRHVYGLRGMLLNMATGHPSEWPRPNWSWADDIAKVCEDGWHIFTVHEYSHSQGLDYPARLGRFKFIPWNIPIFIGECGLDQYTVDPQASVRGWTGHLTPAQYLKYLKEYDDVLRKDSRVLGGMVFTYDWARPWASFNIRRRDFFDLYAKYIESQASDWPIDIVDQLLTSGSYKERPLSAIDSIVIHHTASPRDTTPEQIARYHIEHNGWPGIGYHFVIGAGGEVWQTQHLETMSYHVGNHNRHTIGVAFTGDFTKYDPTSPQIAAGKKLIAYLDKNLAIHPHQYFNPETECPGSSWWTALLPDIEPPIEWPSDEQVEEWQWRSLGIPLNRDSAFYKQAKTLNLGAPLGPEYYDEVFACQSFQAGTLVAKIGEWDKIRLYLPLTSPP